MSIKTRARYACLRPKRAGRLKHWKTSGYFIGSATARPSWTLRDAVAAMDASDTDVLAVTDDDGNFIGVVTEDEILKLDEILDETGG